MEKIMKDQKITSRERVIKALTFEELDCIPIENGFDQELKELYPSDVSHVPYNYPAGKSKGVVNRKGKRIDIWGCTWEAAEDGVCGEVVASPLRDGWDKLKTFQPPWEIINGADLSGVNATCGASKNFMISMWDSMPNPFERMQHLRGTQNLFMDLGYLDKEIYLLRDMVHEYFLKQLKLWVKTDVDGIHIADDWGFATVSVNLSFTVA
jgi:uroporphyrinogen decarboxylase